MNAGIAAGRGVVRIGTRGSALARIQAELVVEGLRRAGHPSRIVIVETAGDRRAPDTAWGEGAFVAAIERALLEGEVDVAVHSAKDVPTEMDPRLRIGAYLERADARDALVVRDDSPERRLDDLAAGTRVGTDSPRRTAFVRARRPDLSVHPLHGNVDTRLRRPRSPRPRSPDRRAIRARRPASRPGPGRDRGPGQDGRRPDGRAGRVDRRSDDPRRRRGRARVPAGIGWRLPLADRRLCHGRQQRARAARGQGQR